MAKFSGWALCLMVCFNLESVVASQFTVGGSNGWAAPLGSNNETYNQWAGRNRFQIGDTLLFKYDKREDSVLQVTQESYNTCNTTGPIGSHTDGNTVFKLPVHGPFYFISGNQSRCQLGEKLIVVVLAPCHVGQGQGQNCKPTPTPVSAPSPTFSPALSPPSPSLSPAANAPATSPTMASPSPSPSPSTSSPSLSPSPAASSPSPSTPSPTLSPSPAASSPSPSPTFAIVPSPSTPAPSPTGSSPTPEAATSPPVPTAGVEPIAPSDSAVPPSDISPTSSIPSDSLIAIPSLLNLLMPLLFAALLNVKIAFI